jgi:hypothetical protein
MVVQNDPEGCLQHLTLVTPVLSVVFSVLLQLLRSHKVLRMEHHSNLRLAARHNIMFKIKTCHGKEPHHFLWRRRQGKALELRLQ